ncbi:MAG: MATE family efflux transporter [Clostridia bacterium]|nr:MATE family efflux transporter [Clostridia bacterium]
MKLDSKTMFASMPPWRLVLTVALPGMVSMFAMSVYSIIEGIFIGQRLGESAFAAVNIAFPIIMINFSLSDLIGVGSSVPISIALGRKDEKSAHNFFTCSVILIFITSLVMGSVMFFAAEPLARLMGADDSIAGTAARYIRTYAVCSPISTIFFAMDNYLRISGYVRLSMGINLFCNAATLILLTVFLLVLEMDVVGSALASCIAMCLCSLLAMIPFLRGKALLRFVRPRLTPAMLGQIAACGSPAFFSNIAGRLTSILMNISLMTLGVQVLGVGGGTTAVAAYSVLMYAGEMCQPLLYGMSDSLAPALGFNWGARNFARVKKIASCGFLGSAAVSLVSACLMFFLARPIASLFVDAGDTALLSLAEEALRLFSLTYLLRWFAIAAQSFLSAIEKPVHATILSTSIALVFPVLLLGALWNWGLTGIWLNMAGTSALALILGIALILHAFARKNVSPPDPDL